MKKIKTKRKRLDLKELVEQMQKTLTKRGSKVLEIARNEILQEKIECNKVCEALNYFMTQYWQDLARPTLLYLACQAVGGDPDITTSIAVSMTLISGGIDIHDDIIDDSKTKRGRPTVFGKFGKDIALLIGDALIFKGLTLIYEASNKGVPLEKIPIIINLIKGMFFELGDAEAMELQFRRRIDVTPEQYLQVVRKKAADVEAHTRISAILGGGTQEEIDALGNYGRLLGMLLILRDDLLDTTDFEEIWHRIEKECLPLPILQALQASKPRSKLGPIISKRSLTKKDIETIREITVKTKGLEKTQNLLKELAKRACLALENVKASEDLKYFALLSLLPYEKEDIIRLIGNLLNSPPSDDQ